MNLLARLDADPRIAASFDRILLVDPLQYGAQKIADPILLNPRYTFLQDSIYNPAVTDQIIGAGDLVIHLATEINSFTAPQTAASEDPLGYLQWLADRRIGRFLFLSSADVYGVNNSPDLQESDPVRPTTIYAAKVTVEAYLSAFHALCGLPIVVFRPVTIFGPHQYPGWLIPRVITQAIQGQQISITGDGAARRDWIFVADVCDLLITAALHDSDDIHGEVFNVGTGDELDVLSLTRRLLRAVGRDDHLITFVPPPTDHRRAGASRYLEGRRNSAAVRASRTSGGASRLPWRAVIRDMGVERTAGGERLGDPIRGMAWYWGPRAAAG